MLDFAVERSKVEQILMLQLHTIKQGSVERSPSLSSTKLRVSTAEATIYQIWVLHRFSVQSHGELRHVLTYSESSAKNSAKFLTLQLPSSLYKPKGKLNECTFLVFLCYMYSMIRPNLAIRRSLIKSNEFGQTGEFKNRRLNKNIVSSQSEHALYVCYFPERSTFLRNNTVAECLNKILPVYRFYIHCTNGFDKLYFFLWTSQEFWRAFLCLLWYKSCFLRKRPSLSSTKLRVSTPKARISQIWVLQSSVFSPKFGQTV